MSKSEHIPVLLNEVIEGLDLSSNDTVIDATVGGAGHAQAILEKTAPSGKLLGIDWDAKAIERAREHLKRFSNRIILKTGNYTDIKQLLYESGINKVNAILLDLGLSLDQLKDSSRGFSFQSEGPLDMRFSDQMDTTAFDIVNTWPENDLVQIFQEYGEERRAARAARNIATARSHAPINTAKDLAELVMRGAGRRGKVHPATRIFQALRIATNHELDNVKQALPNMIDMLSSEGRLAVITFHSLEDRIVKQYFKPLAKEENPRIKLINKKVIKPSREEQVKNPASRSAKLRIVEKI
ncbi:MAG: 16S rRNA (cytosine(1402)-N(4))-methyltransferase [Parcubacteria group bacterium CG1_02_41_12]|nr:MAG: 16S rRNA (cytosine(1402)-N(4))-methyltransferase [Parcubacteria group bacterium CG1_02_41_12]PIP66888.1 MAG: hypothetical protein COW93_03215 [Parcubacteria group bacterium CG22_combo_CG10-13_8_21_14_all_41_9]PIQ80396.1 MAG: hypothetical protein COV79_00715 [Parcubacteria group bacterium CG11_big_fil_rev_8_21_14_0_20_41_14]PIR57263.1 MAG: hypothetical protein COU72_01900 [Parcubacteria group bacterium CG10_big_fil_rev_8_21_14_0_10_41_35]PIZ81246.1 MAG: hypothetical protein COY02_03010 [